MKGKRNPTSALETALMWAAVKDTHLSVRHGPDGATFFLFGDDPAPPCHFYITGAKPHQAPKGTLVQKFTGLMGDWYYLDYPAAPSAAAAEITHVWIDEMQAIEQAWLENFGA
jgi:hypothetical protein